VVLAPVVERPVVGSSSARPTIPTGVFPHFLSYCLSRVELQRDSGAPVVYEALDGFGDLFKDAIFMIYV
jgi:hypothetical protein